MRVKCACGRVLGGERVRGGGEGLEGEKEGGREKSSKTRAHQREQFFSFPVTFCSLTEETGGDRSPTSRKVALHPVGPWKRKGPGCFQQP